MLYCNLFNIQLRFYLRIFSYVFRRIIVTRRWISMLRDEFLTIFCRSTKFNFRWKVAADWFIRFSSIDKIEVTLIFWRKKGKLEKKWPFETRLFDTLMLFRPAMSEIVSCFFLPREEEGEAKENVSGAARGEGGENKTVLDSSAILWPRLRYPEFFIPERIVVFPGERDDISFEISFEVDGISNIWLIKFTSNWENV